eukprot:jgi/Phyca11/105637/e_gw1.11.620.1
MKASKTWKIRRRSRSVTKTLNSGRTVSVLQHAVARRYLEADKMVVVWKTFTEGEGMFAGMHADECGWCLSTPSSITSKPSTLMRTVIRHVPMHFDATLAKEPAAGQFTGLLLTAGSEDATEIVTKTLKHATLGKNKTRHTILYE